MDDQSALVQPYVPLKIQGMKSMQVRLRAEIGRDDKHAHGAGASHLDLPDKCDRLKKDGVKFSFQTLRLINLNLLLKESIVSMALT